METRTEVKTFKIQYECSKCKNGYLEYIGTKGILYVHKCNNKECLHYQELKDKKYPYIEYEIIKSKLLSSEKKGYIVGNQEGDKRLIYGYPTGKGSLWECYTVLNVDPTQIEKVKVGDVFYGEEIEIKEVKKIKLGFIKSLK